MAKLSQETIEEGRRLLLEKNEKPFFEFVKRKMPYLNHDEVFRTFRMVLVAGDIGRGLKLYKALVEGYDTNAPQKALAAVAFGCAWKLVLIVGAIGGCVYLCRVIFG